jgi:hypothetical protein
VPHPTQKKAAHLLSGFAHPGKAVAPSTQQYAFELRSVVACRSARSEGALASNLLARIVSLKRPILSSFWHSKLDWSKQPPPRPFRSISDFVLFAYCN